VNKINEKYELHCELNTSYLRPGEEGSKVEDSREVGSKEVGNKEEGSMEEEGSKEEVDSKSPSWDPDTEINENHMKTHQMFRGLEEVVVLARKQLSDLRCCCRSSSS
jgi:hypothetical protein